MTILGSAAAEGWPALFCACEACEKARRLGGKNIRRRTSYRLGDRVQVDWGPDTYSACLTFGLDTSTLTHLVVTHSHGDHFVPQELFYRRPGFSQVPAGQVLTVHGSAPVRDALLAASPEGLPYQVAFSLLDPFVEHTLDDGVSVTPIPAAHAPQPGGAFNFIFTVGNRRLLIGNDTGWWEEPAWEFLAGQELDVIILDATYGPRRQRQGHLGIHEVLEVREELRSLGALAPDGRCIANHFSHNGGLLHAQLEAFFEPHGIEVGYDGMVVEV